MDRPANPGVPPRGSLCAAPHRAQLPTVGLGVRRYASGVAARRHAMIRDAYHALGRGELAPWMGLLDRAVVWRAVDEADVEQTPT